MLAILDFVRTNAVFVVLALLFYCAWRLKRIESKTEAIRFLLFRDFEQDISDRGMYPISKSRR